MVEAHASASHPPVWNYDLVPGSQWTDPKTGIKVLVPGSSYFVQQRRDPYQDLVYLAKDLGASGVDIDYEEFWHADYYKIGDAQGPWILPQTAYKYAAIVYDVMINIKAIMPTLKVSTAAGAAGAWSTNWWGGNLKGLWYFVNMLYPDAISFMASGPNAGGINVMTYDLSDNPEFHECPSDSQCTLDKQVAFYMQTYQQAGIPANVGYEVGTPAYPAPDHDPTHQLPLTVELLASIVSTTQTQSVGGFLWELFKAPDAASNVSPTQVAQSLCRVLIKSARCSGTIPVVPSK